MRAGRDDGMRAAFDLGPAPRINGEELDTSTSYHYNLPVGNVIEYDLSGISVHPFHNHVNHFQIAETPADTHGGYFQAGDWHDVMLTPDRAVTVRLQTDRWIGPSVLHCHILEHEDEVSLDLRTLCASPSRHTFIVR